MTKEFSAEKSEIAHFSAERSEIINLSARRFEIKKTFCRNKSAEALQYFKVNLAER